MATKKRFTFADAKQKIKDLELELDIAKTRVSKKDFYQGFVWGASAGLAIALAIKFIF